MVTAEERKRILSMIETGKLSVAEGMNLLEVLGQTPGAASSQTRPGRRLRLRVTDLSTGQVIASARLPLAAIDLLQRALARFVPDLAALDLAAWVASGSGSREGRVLDLRETEDGQRVEIFVE